MPEPVLITERIRLGLQLGESHFREFKSALHRPPSKKVARATRAICIDIADTLVAFANADGGELYVGVEDDGSISGLDSFDADQVQQLLDAPRSHVLAETPLEGVGKLKVELGERQVLFFKVSSALNNICQTSDGRCMQRRDLESVPIAADQLRLERQEQISRHYDREFVDGLSVAALDSDLVDAAAQQMMPGIHREKYLQLLDLADYADAGLRLRRAAALLFAREPERWHPRLQVRIVRVNGNELGSGASYNVTSDEVVREPIHKLIDAAWDSLRPHLVQTRISADARFQATYMYPELACREALVNAVAHRDYAQEGRGIEIRVYDDRMEVLSPGPLLSSVTISDLKKLGGVHQSRNPLVARVLKEVGFMRELGEGMRRIFELMKGSELAEPDLKNGADFFSITLHHQQMYSQAEKSWLSQFDGIELNKNQRTVIVLGMGGKLVAPQDIMNSLGIVDWDEYRQISTSLQQLGIVRNGLTDNQVYHEMKSKKLPRRSVPRVLISVPERAQRVDAPRPAEVQGGETIFVFKVPYNVLDSELLKFFSTFGEVASMNVPRTAGGTKGFVFVAFVEEKATDGFLRTAEGGGLHFLGRQLRAQKARTPRAR